jgi:REP element-mobilizing transposase RayT
MQRYHDHQRRSIRLPGFDYSSARAYFVTLCTQNRVCLLGDPIISEIIRDAWQALPFWFPTITLDEFVIMPNHIHFVVWLGVGAGLAPVPQTIPDASKSGAGASPAPTWNIPICTKPNDHPALGDVVGAFKSLVFKTYLDWIRKNDLSRQAKFWQRNYYEHIVRNERELQQICFYIQQNQLNWEKDRDNPDNIGNLLPPTTIEEYLADIFVIDFKPTDEKTK